MKALFLSILLGLTSTAMAKRATFHEVFGDDYSYEISENEIDKVGGSLSNRFGEKERLMLSCTERDEQKCLKASFVFKHQERFYVITSRKGEVLQVQLNNELRDEIINNAHQHNNYNLKPFAYTVLTYDTFSDMTGSTTFGTVATVVLSPYTGIIDIIALPYSMTDQMIKPQITKLVIKKDLKIWKHLKEGHVNRVTTNKTFERILELIETMLASLD